MEIDFACKQFPIEQVLRCSFGLSNAEFKILKVLMARGESSIEEIAAALKKDRTTIQRAIKRLVTKKLVKRRQYNLDSGGYQYHYLPEDRLLIKQRVQAHFERFTALVREEIERW